MRKYFRYGAPILMFAGAIALGCHGSNAPQPGALDLDGNWTLSLAGVSAGFNLAQTADSLKGTAGYSMSTANPPGCGGESIPSSGSVSLAAHVSGPQIVGRMSFGGQWTPPFTAAIASKDTIRGNLMSVDRGGCEFILVRKL